MAEKRIILEMGSGNDLYGGDYTKAACRAVQDALHHSSIILFRSLGYDHRTMRVQVTIGVQKPDQVDIAKVCAGFANLSLGRWMEGWKSAEALYGMSSSSATSAA